MKRMSAVPAPSVSIPYGRQDISEADIAAVVEVLHSDWLTQGPAVPRQVWLLQRKASRVGAGLAKTTGWARSLLLRKRGVHMLGGVVYLRIDDAGLHLRVGDAEQVLDVDTVVICAGQEPRRELAAGLEAAGTPYTLVGGADVAAELDAKRAIAQATDFARRF